jgi:hypothetical protein
MKSTFNRTWLGVILLAAPLSLWAQADSSGAQAAATGPTDSGAQMLTPPPVSGENYSMGFTSETRSNYLRGGLTFTSTYSDNVLGGISTNPVSDISYSVWPTIALDETRSRLLWTLTFAPGFTFYQKTSGYNQASQNLATNFQYRLSPHVTLSLRDSFQRSSNIFNQPNLDNVISVPGGLQTPNTSIIAPLADMWSNTGSAEITYQFSRNGMIGASGTFTNLDYLNQSQVPGLFNSTTQGGSAFYSYRISKKHYLGATYQFQNLLSYPNGESSKTQVHGVSVFYTLYLSSHFSLSAFGGPQYSDTSATALGPFVLPASKAWSPSYGGSIGWRGQRMSFALSGSRTISNGGGLIGAVHSTSGSASLRRQLTRNLSAGISGSYGDYLTLNALSLFNTGFSTGGHTISASASVQRQVGQNFNVQLGYARLHQSYGNIGAISAHPDTNMESVTISYRFSRPLGR